jgi:hypothetical protein
MHRAVAAAVLIVLVTVALMAGAASSTAASMSRVGQVPRQPAGLRVVGSLAGTIRIPVTITLQPPHPAALQSYATAVSTPGSSDYRHYLSVAAFRARFAPTDAQIAAVRSALSSAGLTPSPVSANGLVITLSGSATQLARAFSTSFHQVKLADGRTAYSNTSPPAVPSSIASTIQSVTGLDSLIVAQPLGLGRPPGSGGDRATAERADVVTGGPQPCAAGRALPNSYTADELASAYGFSRLYGQNDLGAGQTIGLLELEPYTRSDVSAYESCYGISASVTNISVDGFDPTATEMGEANGDIEDVIGIAPRASVLDYQAPNTVSALLDVMSRMVSDDRADVLSTSWGICEAGLSPDFVAAENSELEEAAIQGQSFFAATGDGGSAACSPTGPGLSVDDPGGQPFITAVGGTQLSALGPPPTETTWNNGATMASTGGISRWAGMPGYQLGAAPSLNVINGDSSGAPCSAPTAGYCRETPDVSASSSANGGYDFYFGGRWQNWFGTSFAAPLWAAFTALAKASPTCAGAGVDIGFVNPLLYQLAGSDYGKYFNDISTGNNDAADVNGGLYPATLGYDMATGLGSPIGGPLAEALCGGPLTPAVATTVDDAATNAPWTGSETAGAVAFASATVTGAGPVPSGTLTYDLYANAACIAPTLSSQIVSLSVGGVVPNSAATAALNAGSYSYRATYSGDAAYNAAVGPCAVFTVLAPPNTTTAAIPTSTSPPPPPGSKAARPAALPRAVILGIKVSKQTNATITFSTRRASPKGYQCALVKLPKRKKHHRATAPKPTYHGPCSSPMIYRHLRAGHYKFFVHARGSSGAYTAAATARFTIG